jgi:branched-chain amino acid transport system substrate-binding protein
VPSCAETEPDKFYPSGERNYARVVALDNAQAATIATYAKEDLGVKSVYIINDRQAYGLGLATNLENAFNFLDVEVKGNDAWDQKASSYEAIFNTVKASGAEAVVFSGLVTLNGVKLIKDKFAVLGDNEEVKLLAPDGFTPFTEVDKAGTAATTGMFVTVAGSSANALVTEGGAIASSSTRSRPTPASSGSSRTRRTPRRRPKSCSTRSRGRRRSPGDHRQHPRCIVRGWQSSAASR